MFITNVDILKCFVIKRAVPAELVQPSFCQPFVSKRQILDLYLIDLNNQGQNTTPETRQEKPERVLLSQLHFKLSAKFKLVSMTSRLAAWPLNICFQMVATDAEFWASLETNFSG